MNISTRNKVLLLFLLFIVWFPSSTMARGKNFMGITYRYSNPLGFSTGLNFFPYKANEKALFGLFGVPWFNLGIEAGTQRAMATSLGLTLPFQIGVKRKYTISLGARYTYLYSHAFASPNKSISEYAGVVYELSGEFSQDIRMSMGYGNLDQLDTHPARDSVDYVYLGLEFGTNFSLGPF
ncbi:MAG: hypothetical protein OEX00_06550 [Gammaproteobacteria bacterium]|nr:hypothetical protein [Gammaproteobacteria bacterium]MDH5692447.1 hypothetical protein [Gammaproteobacteria bacterium]